MDSSPLCECLPCGTLASLFALAPGAAWNTNLLGWFYSVASVDQGYRSRSVCLCPRFQCVRFTISRFTTGFPRLVVIARSRHHHRCSRISGPTFDFRTLDHSLTLKLQSLLKGAFALIICSFLALVALRSISRNLLASRLPASLTAPKGPWFLASLHGPLAFDRSL